MTIKYHLKLFLLTLHYWFTYFSLNAAELQMSADTKSVTAVSDDAEDEDGYDELQ